VQPPVKLATRPGPLKGTRPILTLTRDYSGGRSFAEIVVAYAEPEGVRSLLVTIPEGDFLVSERACDCAPSPEELRSIPIRGRVESVDTGANRVTITHEEVPGVFEAGTRAFEVAPLDLALLRTGGALIGRFERGPAGWRLFEIRMLGEPAPTRGGK
jgi:Cu/Ag efflux protein CusF